ncbi:hypothetical protein K435DRAFT_776275 [Dendrothele bispora CBS 962.96]|uniref:DRBM domain-containing protein n=1 Tax=Dendrothele bispora (strain CBS 962.96) TaxID=1314807 RepID=A0A4S8MEA3_DENBC|nr:hypothetical protein K435DRAFT_776275 [Dendrothele bispora CBS 962.96]
MAPRYATQLNNLLQVINDGDTYLCSYRETFSGPPYAPIWDVTAFINGRQYGKGSGSSKSEARENASRMALQRLQGEVQNLITSAGGINLGTGTGGDNHLTEGNNEPETTGDNTSDDPEPQTTSQADFDNSHGHDADLFNLDVVHQTSDTSGSRRLNVEQENQGIDGDIENTHDAVNVNIDLDLYPTDVETSSDAPRQDGSGRYTAEDNRRIDRNFENVGTYHNTEILNNDGNLKALFAGGLLTGSGFYAGHTTTQVEAVHTYHLEPALPGNNALAVIYPRSMDQVPSFVLTFMILPTVMGNLFSFIRHAVFGRV